MTDQDSTASNSAAPTRRDRALSVIATATLLALLYFARDVLVPVTLAVILSLLIAPFVSVLRRVGLGQTGSVLAAVLLVVLAFSAIAVGIGSQLVGMTGSLPKYERTLERKLATLNNVAVQRVGALTAQADRVLNKPAETPPTATTLRKPDAAAPV